MKPIFLFDDEAIDSHLRSLSIVPPRCQSGASLPMYFGSCISWNDKRAFGWIKADGDVPGVPDRELFCHKSALPKGVRELPKGARVKFTTRPSRTAGKPPEARVLRVLDDEMMVEAA